MSRFRLFQYVSTSFLVTAAAGYKIKSAYVKKPEVEKSPEQKRLENFNQQRTEHYASAYSASLNAPVLDEIRAFSLEQLVVRLNFWQNSNLSAAELYNQASKTTFDPKRAEDYQDCIIAFMELREFCNKYEAQCNASIRLR